MQYIDLSTGGCVNTVICIKESAMREASLRKYYTSHLSNAESMAISLPYGGSAKPKASLRNDYVPNELLPEVANLGCKLILCADGEYFKTLTGANKIEPNYGSLLPCKWKGFTDIMVGVLPNYGVLLYNDKYLDSMKLTLASANKYLADAYVPLGSDIIKKATYLESPEEISEWLNKLLDEPALTMDIEAFDLKFYKAGLGTITLCWNQHEGIAFPIDYKETVPYETEIWDRKDRKYKKKVAYAKVEKNHEVRALLKEFFTKYQGASIWHNASYDVTVLIYELWMDGLLDNVGLLEGLEVMTRNMHDTKIITYLATNSCAGNQLGLKDQSLEFAGDYAEDVKNILLVQKDDLLRYNLVDGLCTWHVMDKYYDVLVHEEQWDLYHDKYSKYLVDIIQMQLTGMCLSTEKVKYAKEELSNIRKRALESIHSAQCTKEFIQIMRIEEVENFNNTRKVKRITIDEATFSELNPNSKDQVGRLLFDVMGLPVLERTPTKKPSASGDVLNALLNHTKTKEQAQVVQGLIDFALVDKILSSFIRPFEEAPVAEDGMQWVFGSFNLGGTVSGRLSASDPNLQTIPSGSTYAKLIKDCFVPPKGWLFGGADFASLEDRISALTTRDKEKLKVYIDGFDGHSYRALHYWPDTFPEIDRTDPEQVNSLDETDEGKALRGDSKAPTFLLTYQGTYHGLMRNCGFPEPMARQIENNFLTLYADSISWVKEKLDHASRVGYVTCAFGLRVRTPMLKKSLMGTSVTPYQADAEKRTAGNALGQSWCILNSRAANEFMTKVRKSKYKYDIKLAAQIHDAIYLYWRDDWEITQWVNQNLGDAMSWQEDPLIAHDEVKLYGELDIFYPSWKHAITLKNDASIQEIKDTVKAGWAKIKPKL